VEKYQNVKCTLDATFGWNPPKADDTAAIPYPGLPGDFWMGSINTAAGAGGKNIDVNVTLKHDTGKDCFSPGRNTLKLNLSNVVPVQDHTSLGKVTAAQVTHGVDLDVGYLKTSVDTTQHGKSNVRVVGQHIPTANGDFPVQVSFHNETTRKFSRVDVTPDYIDYKDTKAPPVDGPEIHMAPNGLEGNDSRHVKLPENLADPKADYHLSSYRIEAASSPPTITDLAFLGEVDGTFGEMNMGAMFDLMLGTATMLAPYLRPLVGDDTQPLFVGIDLTQWVGLMGSFNPGDVFSLVNGMSDMLPGILVGTSPITLGADGYHTDNPYDGDVIVLASIDGGRLPEPGIAGLVALALAVLAALRRGSRRAAAARPPGKTP